ncbi:MAG: oxidoreductase [Pseudomonadota bacterium]
MSDLSVRDDIFAGLRELADTAFPKRCRFCGREYSNSAEFLAATRPIKPDASGLKQGHDDEGHPIVELFRNCVCGSTLLESYWNRRDLTDNGIMRRKRFHDMADKLVAAGYTQETARSELIKFVRGQPNELLNMAKKVKDGQR